MPYTDYFAAPSDHDAAQVATVDDPKTLGFDVVYAKNIGPDLIIGKLESILTGVPIDSIATDPRMCRVVADPEGAPIVTVTDSLRNALATLPPDDRPQVAEQWSRIEDFLGLFPVDFLNLMLRQLAELATGASARDHHLYCRWSL
jgi:hypothetical protein